MRYQNVRYNTGDDKEIVCPLLGGRARLSVRRGKLNGSSSSVSALGVERTRELTDTTCSPMGTFGRGRSPGIVTVGEADS